MFGGKLGLPELIILIPLFGLFSLLIIVPWFKIFSKAGHPPILSLTMFVPLLNLLVLWWFAFSTWPTEAEAFRLRNSGQMKS